MEEHLIFQSDVPLIGWTNGQEYTFSRIDHPNKMVTFLGKNDTGKFIEIDYFQYRNRFTKKPIETLEENPENE